MVSVFEQDTEERLITKGCSNVGLLFSRLVVPCRLGEEDHVPRRARGGKRDHSRNS